MKRIVTSLALVAALCGVPATAMANHGDAPPRGPSVDVGVSPGALSVHVHSSACDHDRDDGHDYDSDRWRRDGRHDGYPAQSSRVVHRPGGYYELRMVDAWMPAQAVQDVVPQTCRTHGGRHNKVKCWGGYTTTRVIPAHYEAREQWVWVSVAPTPRGYVRARY